MDWFYNAKGQRSGPVTDEALRALYAKGEVFPDTLVWNSTFGHDWKRFDSVSELNATTSDGPPPLPPSAINDTWIWIIALSPLLVGFADIWSKETTGGGLGAGTTSIASLIIWLTCIAMDNRVVARAGSGKRILGVAVWILLTPAIYLFVRARRLQKNQLPALAWVVSVIVATLLTNGSLSSGMYLGTGIPACASNTSVAQVKEIFPKLPINFTSMQAIAVEDIRNGTLTDDKRTCYAKVRADDGNSYGVTYTIEEKDDHFYYFLNVSG